MRYLSLSLVGLLIAVLCLGSGIPFFYAGSPAYAKKTSRVKHVSAPSRKFSSSTRTEYSKRDAQEKMDEFWAHADDIRLYADDIRLSVVSGVIKSSFVRSLTDQGETEGLGIRLARIWSSSKHNHRKLKRGDRYAVVVEKRYRNGEFLGYGRILGGRFINGGRVYPFYFFQQKHGSALYVDECGESLTQTGAVPVSNARISSGYTMRRRHPIFRRVMPHQGVDYAAPVGTPVRSIADGKVVSVGWSGGLGRSVRVKHANGIETMYSHLSRYAKGIKPGVRVRRGQYLGNVGSSGIATGPHLDFRALENGRYINPIRVCNPRKNVIRREDRKAFDARKRLVDNMIGHR